MDNAPMLGNVGAALYGTLTVGALLAADRPQGETYAETVGAVAIVLLVYWLIHTYTEFTEERLEQREPLTLDGLARALVRELTILIGAAIPLCVLLVCWIAGVGLTSATTAALWGSAVTIVVVEVAAGLRADLPPRALIAQAAVGALFGLLVIALRLTLH